MKIRYFYDTNEQEHYDFLYECALNETVSIGEYIFFWGTQGLFTLFIAGYFLNRLTNF